MDSPLISVVIPVYKTEKYLTQCVSSVLAQTYRSIEVILVDDGSPDGCPALCDCFAQSDARVRVIHTENGGAGKARNIGKENSRGELICFIDSDDYISPDMLSSLCKAIGDGADIAECGEIPTDGDSAAFDEANAFPFRLYTREEAMRLHIGDRIFRQTPWNKLYKKSLLAGIDFPVGKMIDDEFWTYRAIGNSLSLARTDAGLYAYRQHESSVMHSGYSEKRLQAVEARSARHEYIRANLPSLEKESCVCLWETCIYQGQLALSEADKGRRNEIFRYLESSLSQYPVGKMTVGLPFSRRFWLRAAEIDLKAACFLRNLLGIGR